MKVCLVLIAVLSLILTLTGASHVKGHHGGRHHGPHHRPRGHHPHGRSLHHQRVRRELNSLAPAQALHTVVKKAEGAPVAIPTSVPLQAVEAQPIPAEPAVAESTEEMVPVSSAEVAEFELDNVGDDRELDNLGDDGELNDILAEETFWPFVRYGYGYGPGRGYYRRRRPAYYGPGRRHWWPAGHAHRWW